MAGLDDHGGGFRAEKGAGIEGGDHEKKPHQDQLHRP